VAAWQAANTPVAVPMPKTYNIWRRVNLADMALSSFKNKRNEQLTTYYRRLTEDRRRTTDDGGLTDDSGRQRTTMDKETRMKDGG
jgi:hypothetical protein